MTDEYMLKDIREKANIFNSNLFYVKKCRTSVCAIGIFDRKTL